MEIIEATFEEYAGIMPAPYHVFNTAKFIEINKGKCEGVKYLLFKDNKYRMGLAAGVRNNMLVSPFSAPFGGFSFISADLRTSYIEQAVELLETYMVQNKLEGVKMTFPPLFYSDNFLAKLVNVLYRARYKTAWIDLDFYVDFEPAEKYEDRMWHNARKNLRLAQNSGMEFRKCLDASEIKEVYDVIKTNRDEKGYPMTMAYHEVVNTADILPVDFFLCSKDNQSVAAAIVYHVANGIVYVPYWGDKRAYGELKPMNFIARSVFEYYRAAGIKKVHIGIGTEQGVPNYGLCEFKESLGCKIMPKYTFVKHVNTNN